LNNYFSDNRFADVMLIVFVPKILRNNGMLFHDR